MTTLIYETVHGSTAYGLAREGSDLDLKGVVVGPRAWYFGYRGGPEQLTLDPDHVRFEMRKLLRLLANANPTVLELLFVPEAMHRALSAEGQRLLDARERFLSRRVGESFGGYALGQLRRIQTHRKWLLAPPAAAPAREAFGLSERVAVPKDQQGAAQTLIDRGVLVELPESFLDLLGREKRYQAAKREWQQFQQWRRERNVARAELEARHGYDTKHAMHLVRLQRMAVEILRERRVEVVRSDREELLAIRDGAWPFERLLEEAERMGEAIREATDSSALPERADEDAIEALGIEIIDAVLAAR